MRIGNMEIPEPGDDYESLAAWFSGFAFSEHYRKVVLSACKEMLRAGASVGKERLTEARLDDLSRVHPSYLDYLARHLHGRMKWEKEFLAQGGFK